MKFGPVRYLGRDIHARHRLAPKEAGLAGVEAARGVDALMGNPNGNSDGFPITSAVPAQLNCMVSGVSRVPAPLRSRTYPKLEDPIRQANRDDYEQH